jgi:phosphatidate cytidylyltransferase
MKNRILSSILLFLIFVPFIIKGDIFFAGLVLVVGLIAFKELFDLKLRKRKLSLLLEVLAYLAVAFLILNNYQSRELMIVLDYRILTFMLFAFMVPLVIIGNNEKYNLQDALYLLGSVLFIGFSFNLIILIRNYSISYLIYFLVITCFTDSFALITGRLIGKNKLAEVISPNKTLEGFIGGTLMGTFAGIIYYLTVINNQIPFIQILIITLTLSIIGQIGDLIFSQIKRYYNKKDFSNLVPGHGGVLDLFDSLIFVVITSILFISIL